MFIKLLLLINSLLMAGSESDHKVSLKDYHLKLNRYEYQLDVYLKKKKTLQPGPELEEALSLIADLHREVLLLKKKKRQLKAHLGDSHPESDLNYDISFFRKKKRKKRNDPLDDKLDHFLVLLQNQYSKYMTYDNRVNADELEEMKSLKGKVKRKKAVLSKEERRKKYIREKLKTSISSD